MKYIKYILFAATALTADKALAIDTDSSATMTHSDSVAYERHIHDSKVPYRYFDTRGYQLAPQVIELIHSKDCCPYGWKFNVGEWEKIKVWPVAPKYDNDPVHGSNGGYMIS